jgi:hypothetical protein
MSATPAARSARSRLVDVLVATVVAVPWVWGWVAILLDAVALLGAPLWAVTLSTLLSISGGAVGLVGGLLVVAALRRTAGSPPAEVRADG